MNELQFQSALCKSLNSNGGFAMKMSHGFLAGVPDLFVSLPGVGNCFLEAKLAKVPAKAKDVGIDITPLQIGYLSRLEEAGTIAGVVVVLVDAKKRAQSVGFFTTQFVKEGNNRIPLERFKRITSPRAMDDVRGWVRDFIVWQSHLVKELANVARGETRSKQRETRNNGQSGSTQGLPQRGGQPDARRGKGDKGTRSDNPERPAARSGNRERTRQALADALGPKAG